MKETMKDKIIRKLTSRKFWLAILTELTVLLQLWHFNESDIAVIIGTITCVVTCVAYIIGEGLTDAAHKDDNNDEQN